MKESFDEIDTDKDGAITTEEFQARMRSRTGGRGRGGDRTRGGPPERSGEAARGGSTGDTGTKAGSKDRPQRPAFDE
jgi:hypothetical protein